MRALVGSVTFLLGLWLQGCNQEVVIPSPPSMQVGIDRIEFGAIPVGKVASRILVVQNRGASNLGLAVPSFLYNDDQAFGVSDYDQIIHPGGEGTMTVTFAPRNVRRYESVLVVVGNDPENPSARVQLGGDGYRQGAIEVEPLLVDFGTVNAGSVGLGQFFIRNLGNGDLKVEGIETTPSTSPDYQILSSTQGTLSAGSEATIRLAYRPGPTSFPPGEGQVVVLAADPFQPETAVTLTARLNRAPLPDAGEDQQVDPLDQVTLDGGGSSDPDGDLPLSFAWTLVRSPEGSWAVLVNAETETPSLVPDLVGIYEVELYVKDSTQLTSLLPDRVTVTAIPADRLLVELVWDSPIADQDLHLLAPGGSLGGMLDCFYANREPDWGEPGNPADDPKLKRDDLMGFGPETIGYQEPLTGTFRLAVDYFAAHTPSGREPTTATLRVFVDGLLKAEIARRLESQGQIWTAASVLWPEGVVSEMDLLE